MSFRRPLLCATLVASGLLGARVGAQSDYGFLANPTGIPVGGGEGYGHWVTGQVVSTRAQLLDALRTATPGATVYVRDDVVIDLTGFWEIRIPGGVTLASGRGRNGSLGALLFTNEKAARDLFQMSEPLARITGLRLRGPDTEIEPPDCGENDAVCVGVHSSVPVTREGLVDNNEMWGWPQAAVATTNVFNLSVVYNHIHHNRRQVTRSGCRAYGLGYGVALYGAGLVYIDGNLFDHNRHDIACSGAPFSVYQARYNLVLDGAVQHSFDVHAFKDDPDAAGFGFVVYQNTFLQSDKPAFRIRAIPQIGAFVFKNEFRHSTESAAANQVNYFGNLWVSDNRTSVNRYPAWFVSFSGDSYWRWRRFEPRGMNEVHLADFDGDGTDDAFMTSGGRWWLSRSARDDFVVWGASNYTLADLRFGDFDGDGRTDVFRSTANAWYVSHGGNGSWIHLGGSSAPLSSLGFADFDGDGRTDVFWGDGSTWRVSYAGTSSWVHLQTSGHTVASLRFGDFDGDHRADVFRTDGSTWYVSWGGTSSWRTLNRATVSLSSLGFADLDGDGRTDVFYGDGATWRVSFGGTSPWQTVNRSALPTGSLQFGDVNGDGKADVLSRQSL